MDDFREMIIEAILEKWHKTKSISLAYDLCEALYEVYKAKDDD